MSTTPAPRSIRVLHVIDSGGLYGAERVLLALAIQQAHRAIAPAVALMRPAPAVSTAAERAGVPCTVLRPSSLWRASRDLVAAARSHGADVIHSHGLKPNILLAALPRRLRGGLPVVTTVHGWTETTLLSRMAWYAKLDRALLRRLDAVVFVHGAAASWYGIDRRRLRRTVVIENGIVSPDVRRRIMGPPVGGLTARIAEVARGRPVVLAAGRLSPEKGHGSLMAAIAELRRRGVDVLCVVLGDGACRADLERLCRDLRLGADEVMLPGFSELDQGVFEQASVFCLPSLSEGLPLVLLEAMQAGVPIVATRVGGVPGTVDGIDGCWLAPPADPGALAGALAAAVGAPRPTPAPIARRFASERMARQYEALYRDLIAGVSPDDVAGARRASPAGAPPTGRSAAT